MEQQHTDVNCLTEWDGSRAYVESVNGRSRGKHLRFRTGAVESVLMDYDGASKADFKGNDAYRGPSRYLVMVHVM